MWGGMRTTDVVRATGYSLQQVRDLERLGVVPAAHRTPAGHRDYTDVHVDALLAYRALALAAGPVAARRLLPVLLDGTPAEAAAAVDDLHAGLARERADVLAALDALRVIRAEDAPDDERDVLTITELAAALRVRTSTLRFWEDEGLVHPDRVTSVRARSYGVAAVREARIVAALRGAGYGVPAVREAMARLGDDTVAVLDARLAAIAGRSVALLRAGAAIAALIERAG